MARLPPNYTLVRIGKSLGDSITFQGIDDEKLNRVYNSCDVLLFPSHEEGFGVPVPEAFAAGLPVVASAIPSIIEVSAGAALLLPADDSKALAKAIVDVTTSPDELVRLGQERSKCFSPGAIAPRLERLYSTIGHAS